MSKNNEKRMIGDTGYFVIESAWAGNQEFVLAENRKFAANQRYMVCTYTSNGIIGQYAEGVTTGDLAEARQEMNDRAAKETERITAELDSRGLPSELFTAEHCVPHDYKQNLNGTVVAIRADVLSPEYRRGSEQLVYVTGGFGASPNARGTAVFCRGLSDGEQTRFNRNDVLGIVKELPDWAKDRLTTVKAQIAAERVKSKKDRGDAR
jgi:hypothetical protein